MTRAALQRRSESELSALRKQALEFASARKETPTTVHLLAAVATRPGLAQELLLERSLDRDAILKASRSFDEDASEAIGRALSEAKDVAKRSRGFVSTDGDRTRGTLSPDSRLSLVEPTGLHVLVALLANRQSAAHRALALSGVDVTRLRAVALANASGVVPVRRTEKVEPRAKTGSVVPLFPPGGHKRSEPEALASSPAPEKRASVVPPPRPKASPPQRRPRRAPDVKSEARPRTTAAKSIHETKVVHREAEVLQVLDVLAKHRGNTPCLVGPAGVGKTSIARAVEQELAQRGKQMIEASIAELFAGTGTRGALAERLTELFDRARAEGNAVVFFDDVHELLGGGDEAVLELKNALMQGDVQVVCATSVEAYRRTIEPDTQLARRIVPIEVHPPEESDAFFMVRAACETLEKHHRVGFDDMVIAAAIGWTVRYLPGRALPDKAIAALDLAAARLRRTQPSARDLELSLEEVAEVVARSASVPIERLLESDRERLLSMEQELKNRVIGHRESLARIAAQLRKSAAGLRHERPMGSFLLLGPTGVGKTETAKAIAGALFGSADAMTRIDLSEFAESHALARLIGAPPGYVGHEAGGQLTEAVRRRPYQVVLLDEIEKAHPEVLLCFLQVLDEGRLSDGRGRLVDFRNVVVVMTSNLGSRELAAARKGSRVGFGRADDVGAQNADIATSAAKKHLPIELYGRIDEVLVFSTLTRAEVGEVAERMVNQLVDTMAAREIRISVDPEAIEGLLDAGGFDPELGARPLRRTIARLVEAPLADLILSGELAAGGTALLTVEDGQVIVDRVTGDADPAHADFEDRA